MKAALHSWDSPPCLGASRHEALDIHQKGQVAQEGPAAGSFRVGTLVLPCSRVATLSSATRRRESPSRSRSRRHPQTQ